MAVKSATTLFNQGIPPPATTLKPLPRCWRGPLVTSLLEWEAPSPLTAGLYGGAAAAAIAAAASDYRDPTRRGQTKPPINAGERTTGESVEMRIEYPQLPLPGVPFRTNVKWSYERFTTEGVSTFSIDETRVNAQFLLGSFVVTDKPAYNPGERVHLTAAIWDYQPRPCDGYHVVAHLILHARPKTAFRGRTPADSLSKNFSQRPPDTGGINCFVWFSMIGIPASISIRAILIG
ncbi:MAG: hypothetical protein IPM81_05085 [Saprospirales bacterium]|nr:hypothetical protein [Saprospirales bacterium]